MNASARITLVGLGTLAAALLLTHGAWLLVVACVAALDSERDIA